MDNINLVSLILNCLSFYLLPLSDNNIQFCLSSHKYNAKFFNFTVHSEAPFIFNLIAQNFY